MSSAADSDSHLQSLVLRLGNFHTQMGFLGCIGHLMGVTGLQEAFELVYAENVVVHILNGKAYSRAVRAHLLMDAALSAILTSGAFDLPWILIHHQAADALLGDESDDSPRLMDTSVAEEVFDMEEIAMVSSTQKQWQTFLRLLTRSCHKQVVHPQRRLALQTWKPCPRLATKTLMLLSAFLNDLRQVASQPKKQLTMMWYLRSTNVWRSTKKVCPEVEQAASGFNT